MTKELLVVHARKVKDFFCRKQVPPSGRNDSSCLAPGNKERPIR